MGKKSGDHFSRPNFDVESHGDIRFCSKCRRYTVMTKLPACRGTPPFNPFPTLLLTVRSRVLYASLTPPVTSADGSRATVGRLRIRRKEIQPPRPAARRCTRLLPRLRSLKACPVDVPQTYGDVDAYRMRSWQYCELSLAVRAQ